MNILEILWLVATVVLIVVTIRAMILDKDYAAILFLLAIFDTCLLCAHIAQYKPEIVELITTPMF